MCFFRKMGILSVVAMIAAVPCAALATGANDGTTVTSKLYVDNKVNAKIPYNATNKVVITPTTATGVAGTRDITTAGANITSLENANSTGATNIPTAYAVKEAITTATTGMITDVSGKQTKPSSGVANGKVLTYTGTDANANVSAEYVKVPVASGDPNAASNPATPTGFASIWVE